MDRVVGDERSGFLKFGIVFKNLSADKVKGVMQCHETLQGAEVQLSLYYKLIRQYNALSLHSAVGYFLFSFCPKGLYTLD